jgi:uncharacterized protein (TIGR02569 family)
MSPPKPSEEVLSAFGMAHPLIPLSGGSYVCYSDGNTVLKPSEDEEESQWIGATLCSLANLTPSLEYRIPRPVRNARHPTSWIANGWMAMSYLPGKSEHPVRFKDILRVSQAFHDDLAKLDLEKPAFFATRANRWSEADRVIWGEKNMSEVANVNSEVLAVFDATLEEYQRLTKPLSGDIPSQLIHADLTGNVLFDNAAEGPPGIIDLTFYWRPAAYAQAIVVADGLAWHKQGRELVELYGTDEERLQLLVRALHWRCLTFTIDPIMDWVRVNIPKVDFLGAARLVGDIMTEMSS